MFPDKCHNTSNVLTTIQTESGWEVGGEGGISRNFKLTNRKIWLLKCCKIQAFLLYMVSFISFMFSHRFCNQCLILFVFSLILFTFTLIYVPSTYIYIHVHLICIQSGRICIQSTYVNSEAVVRRCIVKKLFLESSQNSQESTCARESF